MNGYTVKFVDEDGTTVLKGDKTYDYGTKAENIERPADPTKQGYTFAGWTPEIVDVTANATYKATYAINQYTITFDTDGGSEIAAITQDYNTAVTAPADPTKEGYTFLGWNKTIPATMPAENMTITAKWSSVIWELTLPYTVWTLTDNWAKFENLTLNFSPADPSIGRMQDGYRVWYKFIAPEAVTAENIANTTYSNNGGNTWKNFNNAKDGIENGRYYMQAWVPLTVESVEAFIAEGKTMKWTYKFAWDWNQENAQTFVIEVDPANVILNNNSDTDPQIKTVNGVIVDKNENFKVSFDSNGWTSVADQTIRYNAKVTAPADPTRDGYTFAGWFKQWAITVFDFENTAIIENTALIAQWTADEHTVTYNNTKWANNQNPATFTTNTSTIELSDLSVAWYTFNGWYDAENEWNKVEQITQWTTTNIVLYAHWTPITYNIIYTQVPEWYSAQSTYNIEQSVSIPNPTRDGYTFRWWKEYVDEEYTKDYLVNWNSVTIPVGNIGDRKYEAQWTQNTYTVTFQTNGWELIDNQTLTYGQKVTIPQTFATSKAHYDLDGWYTDKALTISFDPANDTVTSNLTLYAKWSLHTYSVSFADEDTYTLDNKRYTYTNQFIQNSIRTPSKEWYTFLGWSWKDINGDEISQDNWLKYIDVTQNFFNTYGWKNYKFTPHWEINHYVVTFDSDGGSEVESQNIYHGNKVAQPEDPIREWYTFVGWYNGSTVYDFTTPVTSNLTLTAHWANNVWTMEAISPNGTIEWNEITFSNATVSFSPADPNTGRINWYFVWVKFHAPEYITSERLGNLQYSNDWWKTWKNWPMDDEPDGDGRYYMDARYPIDATEVPEQLAAWAEAWFTKFTKTYVFDNNWWSHDDAQSFTIVYKFDNITLTKDGEVEIKIVDGEVVDKNQNYDVTFDSNGGSNVYSQSIRYNQKAQKPADPTRDGYTFAGWKLEGEDYDFDNPIKSDIELEAQWTINEYTISFNMKWHGTQIESIIQNYDTNVTAPQDPSEEWYIFGGWYTDTECTDWNEYTFTTMPLNGIVLYAKWTPITYKVHFNGNENTSGEMSDQSFTYDEESKSLTTNGFSKAGYTFAGWATSSDGEVVYTDGQSVQNLTSENNYIVNLYAKWTANTDTPYKVKYCKQDLEDETKFEDCESEDKEWTTDTDTAAVAKTYEWFTAQSFEQLNINWDESTVVEIRYTRNSYILSYEYTNTPESSMPALPENKTYKFWAPITLAVAPSMYGYTFGWWQNFPEGNTMPANDVTVKWTWTPVKYTVSVSTKTNAEDSALWWVVYGAGDYGYKSQVTLFAIPNEWYDFIGWTWEWQDELVKPQVKVISSLLANQTLTAHFQTSEYSVEFDSDGGTAVTTQNIKHWLKATKPADPSKEWYTFNGWFKGSDEYDFDTPVTSDLQLKAHWTINQYTITFDTDGGSEIAPITQDYGTVITSPANPTKDGYTFDGWDKTIPATMPAENMTITAQWEIAHYGVVLRDDDHSTLSLISHESGEDIQYGETVKVSISFDDRYQLDSISSSEVILTKESESVYSFVMPAGWVDVTLKSKPVEYRIKYNWIWWSLPSGKTNPASYNIENYDDITLNNPIKDWSTFKWWQLLGWELFYDGKWSTTTQVEIDPDEIWTIQKFSAVWDVNKYTVGCHIWDDVSFLTVEYDQIAHCPSQSNPWYSFKWWYKDPEFTELYNNEWITSDIDLYAKYTQADLVYYVHHRYLDAEWNESFVDTDSIEAKANQYIIVERKVLDGYKTPQQQYLIVRPWVINEVTYTYERAPFTITYMDGNNQINKQTVLYGENIPVFEPVKEWYEFDGWYRDSELTEEYEIPETMPAENIVVYAKYTRWEYEVRYMNGETVVERMNVKYGEVIPTTQAIPVKEGYTFDSWIDVPATMPAHDLDIQAKWNIQKYTVTFVNEDGTELEKDENVEYGTMPTYDWPTPTKESTVRNTYEFAGWDPELSPVVNDVTYTAKYNETINRYTIKFVNEDGTQLQSSIVAYGQTPSYNEETPTKDATAEYTYTFKGWDSEIVAVTSDKTYTATYTQTPNTYTITFDTDGWTTIPSITAGYGSDITQPADPEKQWHHFDGWTPALPETMPAENMTITAQWTKYYYNLTLTPALHSRLTKKTTSQNGTYAYNDEVEVSVSVDDGYRLSNIIAVATTTQWDQEVTLFDQWNGVYSFFMPANPVVISTEVEAIDYGIEYDLAGGSVDAQYPDSYNMDNLTLSLNNPTREGYTFKWWKDEKWRNINAGNTTTTININSSDKSSKIYTAQWDVIEYNVKYYVDGTLVWSKKVSHNEQADITTYRPDVEEWYYFDGWYLDSQKQNRYTLDGVVENIELYGFVIASDQWYVVKHRYEKLDGWYDEVQISVTENVKTNDIVSPEFAPRDWFKNPSARKVIQIRPGWLSANEVIYEYSRNSYQVTYKNDGEDDQYRMVKFEDYIPVLAVSSKTGQTFKGWYKVENDEVTDEKLTNLTTMSTSPVIYKAVWDDEEYTITFNVDGGSVINPITGKYWDPISVDAPTKPGYTFAWWDPALPATMPATDLVVKAQWTANNYTLTFDTDGWTLIPAQLIPYWTVISKPANPTKEWYTFAGWDKTIPATMPAEDVTITAQWNINQYTITIDKWNWENPMVISQDYGTAITTPADPEKEWYTFAWWNPTLPATMPAENVTVTAQWTINKNKVVLEDTENADLNYLTVPSEGNKFDYGTIVAISLHVDDGYSFTINSNVDLVNRWNGVYEFRMPDEQVTISVESSAKSYNISYELDGGSLADWITNPVNYGPDTNTLILNNPTRNWYEFKWWKDETWRLFYQEGSNTTTIRIQDSPLVDKEYTAQWKVNTYLVKFIMDGQIVDQQRITYKWYANYVNQSKDGYEFPGWYTDPDFAQWTEYNFNTPVTSDLILYGNFVASDNEYIVIHKYLNTDWINYELVAQHHTDVKTDDLIAEVPFAPRDWFVNPSPKSIKVMANAENIVEYVYQRGYFDIVYDVNGWTPEVATQNIMFGTKIPVPANPTRDGYTFRWWKKQWTIEILNDNTILNDAQTVTYVAQWWENEYTITFDTDGGSVIDPITQDYGTAITAPADPTKEGYTFAGWAPAIPAIMPLNGLTVKAQWTANKYTITFDTDGWSAIDPITQDYGTSLIVQNPTKSGYTFKWWNPALPATVPAGDIVVVAQWEKSWGSSSGGGGWGGWSSRKSDTSETPDEKDDQKSDENMHASADDEVIQSEEVDNGDTTEELVIEPEALSAYEWARKYNITTMDTVEEADPDGYVLRWHLAKMVVNYMVNVLWREVPYDIPYECVVWNDDPSIWESEEIRDYATKSCALWVMWIQMWNNEFKPNDIVTRAEFGTVVSRILWWDKYNSSNTKWRYRYTLHLRALKNEWIMTQITRPMKWLEIRKWVWVVMMRAQESLNK